MTSFSDEMVKIAKEGLISLPTPLRLALLQKAFEKKEPPKEQEKKAGVLKNVGTMAKTVASDTAANIGGLVRSMGNPSQALKQGWNAGGWNRAQELANVGELASKSPRAQALNRFIPGNKAVTLGSTALMAPGAISQEDPTGQGRSRAERIGALTGGTLLGLASTPYMHGGFAAPMIAGTAASMVGDTVGGKMGKMVGKLKKRKIPDSTNPPDPSSHSMSEYANDGPSASATRTERTI